MRWFASGFVLGAAFYPVVELFKLGGEWLQYGAPLSWWVFEANPAIWLICDVWQRADLCIGLGFDSGPLEPLEYAWFYTAHGLLLGTFALGARYAVDLWQQRRQVA